MSGNLQNLCNPVVTVSTDGFVVITERPSPPLNLNFTDQSGSGVTLTWETPVSNGGSMITGYIIEKCDEGTDKWLRCNARLCPDLSYRVLTSLPPVILWSMYVHDF